MLEIIEGWADATWPAGIAYGTVGLRKGDVVIEITTYRSEHYVPESRKPAVSYGTSLEGDLARRDFTINAMAARLPSYELVDLFGGLRDLQDRVLRTPGRPQDSLADDPLRTLRAARFAAQLGFSATPELAAAMTELAPRLSIVSAERISAELAKLLLARRPGGPERGIAMLVDTGVAEQVLPEVPRLRLEADEHYRHKDVYQHSLTVLDQAIALEARYEPEPGPALAAGRAAARHRQAKDPVAAARRKGRLPSSRCGRRQAGQVQAQGAAVPGRRDRRRSQADRAAPAVPRLRQRRVDRLGRAPLRRRRRPVADQAARPDQGRLHDQEQS